MTHESAQALTVRVGADGHGGALGEYRQRKLVLAELIQQLMTIARERRDEEREASTRGVLARLAEDAFQLAVVGQFSRGKSTLMNAMLGGPYLPAGALPMTSVLTTVRYGSEPRAWVRRAGSDLAIDVPLDQLVRYVAQHSGERQELQIVAAEIELPAEILRLGFSFVDTPGIGSAIAANTATTAEFLPRADAVIFVTGCDAPLSQAEQQFLASVRRHVEKLFLVVNKTDLVDAEEAGRVLRFVRDQLADDGRGEARVFALSARRALQARMTGDRALLHNSGLPALEQPLTQFLAGEKSRVLLERTCGRARRALALQQADLQLARAAQARDAAARAHAGRRFDRGVEDLSRRAHALAIGVRDQLAASLAPLLLERSRPWPQELNETITALIAQTEDRRSTRRRRRQQLAAIGQAAGPLLEEWTGERAAEVQTLLFATAGERIQALLALRQQVQPLAAAILGLPDHEDTAGGWSPADLPPLRTPRIAFDERPKLASGLSSARPRDSSRQLQGALEASIDVYCQQARDAFAQAAEDWTRDLDDRVQRDLADAAARVRSRLDTPYRDDHATRLEDLASDLSAFQGDLVAWMPSPDDEPEAVLPTATDSSAVAGPCAICQRVAMVPFEYLAHAQYELATRADRRAEHAAAGGFCPLHTWLYAQAADPVGIALTYAELATTLAGELHSAAGSPQVEAILQQFRPTPDRCPVCRALGEAERAALADVLDQVSLADGTPPPINLCVGHLAAVLACEPPMEQARSLIAVFAGAMLRAAEDMRTFALKRQALRRGLLNQQERTAPLQAILRIAGHRELARPWRTDEDDRIP